MKYLLSGNLVNKKTLIDVEKYVIVQIYAFRHKNLFSFFGFGISRLVSA